MTTDNLPPLPQPEFDNLLDHIYEYGTLAEGTIPRARALCEAYARAAILAERERCAKVCKEWASICDSGRRHGAKVGAQECAKLIQSQDETEGES